ncbi:SDR family oxidoreductase [Mycolicibacterium cosmeticum]|uniref:SDR family oxidoreductase n=1 Tax=Mycolicibacterium cosmeticum TaxID=258533 RepID=UPI003204E724
MTHRYHNIHRVVAVTGGARGIGRATALAFAEAGARVAIGDLDGDLAVVVADEISAATSGQLCGLPLDVTDRGAFRAFLDAAEARLGPLDILVNNAGVMPTGMFTEEDDSVTDLMVAVNVMGVLTGSKLAVQRLSGRSGRIVNVASLAGISAHRGVATYCGTKHAVVGFSNALRMELKGSGIGVTLVLPGLVRTDLSAGSGTPGWVRPVSEVQPEEVAVAIVDAVVRGYDKVVVPRSLGMLLGAMHLLPARTRDALQRITRLDTAFTSVDAQARARYHARIMGSRRDAV